MLLRVDESTYEPVRDFFKTRGGKAMVQMTILLLGSIRWHNGRFFYTELGHDVRSLDALNLVGLHIIEAPTLGRSPK